MEIKEMLEGIKKGIEESKNETEKLNTRIKELEAKSQRVNFATPIQKKNEYFEGQKIARLWKCQVMAQKEKKSVTEMAQQMYGKDANFIEEVKSLMAGGDAGQIIETQYFNEILPLLYKDTIFDKMGVKKIPMPKGNITIRKMIEGATASYIGETQGVKPSAAKFAKLKLSSKKLAVKTIISNDLLRSGDSQADRMIRDDLLEQLKIAMDYHILYGLGTEYSPMGIANAEGVNKITKKEVVDGDKIYNDMVTPLKKANIPMTNLGWIMNPEMFAKFYNETFPNGNYKFRDELKQGKFHGIKFVETNQIVTGTDEHGKTDIFLGDFSKFMIGEQLALEVKTSEDATYLDEDGNLQSAFDNDETVIKGLMIHDFGVAYGKAFSMGNYYTK